MAHLRGRSCLYVLLKLLGNELKLTMGYLKKKKGIWNRNANEIFVIARKSHIHYILYLSNHISSDVQFTLHMQLNNSQFSLSVFEELF